MDQPTHRWVKLHGQEIGYRSAGSGAVLLLLHGIANSSETWSHVLPSLAERFTVVAPDLLGHGASAAPPGITRWARTPAEFATC